MHRLLRVIVAGVVLALASTACSAAGRSIIPAPTASGGQTGGGSVGTGGLSGESTGGPGGSGGDPDGGSGVTIDRPGGSAPADQGPPGGHATVMVPKPGRLDVHPVGASGIETTRTGRRVVVKLSWWSGVAPCSVLDSVAVSRTGSEIRLTILEGADERGIACIEIAMFKATLVDLGELPPGSYTVSAGGQAPPVRVVVD